MSGFYLDVWTPTLRVRTLNVKSLRMSGSNDEVKTFYTQNKSSAGTPGETLHEAILFVLFLVNKFVKYMKVFP